MARKNTETSNSIALFDEEPPVKKAPVQAKTKQTKKKNGTDIKNNNSDTDRVVNRRLSIDKTSSKEGKTSRKGKQQSTSSANEKSRNTSKSTVKSASRSIKDSRSNSRSTKSSKNNTSKSTTHSRIEKVSGTAGSTSNKVDRKRKVADSSVSKDDSKSKGNKDGNNSEIFKEARKRKHKFVRCSEVMGPKQITGKPKIISDDLVAVVIDGELYEVSPWSIRNGMYCQGYDSHFLVNYLHYEPISTKYDEIDAKDRKEFEELNKKKKK